MSTLVAEQSEETVLINRCLAGDAEALDLFRVQHVQAVVPMLLTRGASASQADEILGTLWTDCVVGRDGDPPLLSKYRVGRGSLQTWVRRIAINRLFDQLRKDRNVSYLTSVDAEESTPGLLMDSGIAVEAVEGGSLRELLRASLAVAFERAPAEGLLMLRLVYLEGLEQREVARMWGCHRATVSRELQRAMQGIEEATLDQLRRIDPLLRLTWEDFVDLCDSHDLDFL